jgi:sulfate adenylyltransferase
LNSPYGGRLVDLRVDAARGAEMKATAKDHASLTLDERGLCDLELLAVGGFSPLTGFMGKADYDRVVAEMRLADGTLWPLPVALPVTPGDGIADGKTLALRDVYGNLLAFLHVQEIYAADKAGEAQNAYGSSDSKHPSVAHLQRQPGHYAAGRLEVLRTPPHYDFTELRRTPQELRDHFAALGWNRVVAFQTRNPLHRAHEELTKRAARQIDGGLLIHRGRIPDPQPAAPRSRGTDQARGEADRRRTPDPPCGRRDQAGRCGPLHPCPLLPRTRG